MKKTFINFPANRAPKIQSRRFGLQSFVNVAYKTDGKEGGDDKGEIEIKTAADLLKAFNETKEGLEKKSKEDAKAEVTEQLKTVNQAIAELKEVKPEVTALELKAIKDELDTALKALNILSVRVKGQGNAIHEKKSETKSFNDILAETIERNASAIQSYRMQQGEVSFDMMPEVKAEKGKEREVKAVGDMSITANFSSAGSFTQDIRSNVIPKPYERTWLGDILPAGTSNGTSILYPKENGGEGAAALWTDPTADKAQIDFDLTGQSSYFKWISGYVIIAREMLDDIAFLSSYLQNKMLISLKIAENAFILNGSSDTNPVTGLLAAATAYNGNYAKRVDRIIDAAWGQLVEDTFDFYNPTTTILTPRDAVAIGLNTADGSGEYDLPAGSMGFAAGKLLMGGLDIVKTTSVGSGNFLTFDKNATMFVKRMQPELRMFEDATLAKKNKIMFRVEERATLAIFNNAALVTGTLTV